MDFYYSICCGTNQYAFETDYCFKGSSREFSLSGGYESMWHFSNALKLQLESILPKKKGLIVYIIFGSKLPYDSKHDHSDDVVLYRYIPYEHKIDIDWSGFGYLLHPGYYENDKRYEQLSLFDDAYWRYIK